MQANRGGPAGMSNWDSSPQSQTGRGDMAQTYRKNVETDWRMEERLGGGDYRRSNQIAAGPAPALVDVKADKAQDRTGEMKSSMQWQGDGGAAQYDRGWRIQGEGSSDPFGPAHGSPNVSARQGGKARVQGRSDGGDLTGSGARAAMRQSGMGPDYHRSDTIQAGPSPPIERQGNAKRADGAVGEGLQWSPESSGNKTWRSLEMQQRRNSSEPSIMPVAGVNSSFDVKRGDRIDRGGVARLDGNRHHCTDTSTLAATDQYARTSIAAQASAAGHVERAQPIQQRSTMADRLRWVAAAPASAAARMPGGAGGGRGINVPLSQAELNRRHMHGAQPGAPNDLISWGGDSAQARAARAQAANNHLPSGRRRLQQQKRRNYIPGQRAQRLVINSGVSPTRPTRALR
jgi:hypothetical protein